MQRWAFRARGKIIFHVGVFKERLSILFQVIHHTKDNVAVPLCAVKNASAISKAAFGLVQFNDLAGGNLQHADVNDSVRYLLPISSNVLHRSAADSAGNPAQALDSRIFFTYGMADKLIPVFSCADAEKTVCGFLQSLDGNPEDQARPAFVGNDQVASAAEHKQRQFMFRSIADGPLD